MTILQAAALIAQALAAGAAFAVARRRSDHWPVAVALIALLSANLIGVPLASNALLPPRDEPWRDWHRWLVYLDGAVQLSFNATVGGLALVLAVENKRRALVVTVTAWLLASIVLAALYPSPMVRGPSLQRIYFATDLIGLFVGAGSFLWWMRQRRSPSPAQVAALILLFGDAAILLAPQSPWLTDLFGDFSPAQVGVILLFAVLTALQVALWRLTR